ncbi:MAG: exodeoxyribonuclease III [Myxococcota bacterium]
MKLVTWNVNSIRARKERALAWLQKNQPDVVCLQELKTEEAGVPVEEFAALGYSVAMTCQRTYNGVAILSRTPISDVVVGLQDDVDDPQARLIAGTVGDIRIICAYMPNGQTVGSEKYTYKLEWMQRLRRYLHARCDLARPLALCGDFNVAPDERDVQFPDQWAGEVLFHQDARDALERLRALGLVDTFRIHHQEGGLYSWWDYRMLAFPKNNGLRIDHVFATPSLAERCTEAVIDRQERKGKQPSDHAPVVVTFR